MKRGKGRVAPGPCKLEMTPMIDVVFQLLIFFIVALRQDDILSHLDVRRPEGRPRPVVETENFLQVTVHGGGFDLQGFPVTAQELDRKLSQIAKYSKTVSIMVKCSRDSSHGQLVQVLDICARHEMRNLNLFSI